SASRRSRHRAQDEHVLRSGRQRGRRTKRGRIEHGRAAGKRGAGDRRGGEVRARGQASARTANRKREVGGSSAATTAEELDIRFGEGTRYRRNKGLAGPVGSAKARSCRRTGGVLLVNRRRVGQGHVAGGGRQ